jgi:hypothetical protein
MRALSALPAAASRTTPIVMTANQGLARSDASGHLALFGLDLLCRQRTAIFEAASAVVLETPRSITPGDEQGAGEDDEAEAGGAELVGDHATHSSDDNGRA